MTMEWGDVTRHVLIIAEIGANHEGNVQEAHRLIDLAASCGVDAVKFQTYHAEKIVARSEPQRRDHFRRVSLASHVFRDLADHAQEKHLIFLSTPFDHESVDLLAPLVPAFKVASGDLTAVPLLEHIARQGKPVLVSTGMATLDDIISAIHIITGAHPEGLGAQIVLLHCVSAYPTPDAEANLQSISFLHAHTGRVIGYSDHTLGTPACLAAVALGARVIEKHFTADKSRSSFRDHQLSADPEDMAMLVHSIRRIEQMVGEFRKEPTESEASNRVTMRRSLAAAVAIPRGATFTKDHLTVLRPGTGLPPSRLEWVLGRRATHDLLAGELLTADTVEREASCNTSRPV